MKLSYSILTHDEDESLLKLLNFLVEHKDYVHKEPKHFKLGLLAAWIVLGYYSF